MAGPGGWDRDVASAAFQSRESLVLVDPLVADDWSALDALAAGRPVAVVLAAAWHERSSAEAARRYGATVFVHEAGQHRVKGPSVAVTEGEVLPSVEVLSVAGADEGEVALWLPTERTLITAEVLVGTPEGLRVSESPALRSRDELWAWVGQLEALPVERVLPSHGTPALESGREELAAALQRPPW
jgi:glyoxylase-like metal-dependent hydrolase (beta-lactamase superfamily II)